MTPKKTETRPETVITSHTNLDFDAMGSMLAAQKLYPDAMIIFPDVQEKNLKGFFINSMKYLFDKNRPLDIDVSQTRRLVIVDTRQRNRLTGIDTLLKNKDLRIDIYDHHPPMPGEIKGDKDVSRPYGATTTIMCELLRQQGVSLTAEEATVMALGIYENTGNFTYDLTTPQDLAQAGYLLECGASLSTISSLVVKEIKTEQVTWLNQLITEMTSHHFNGVKVHLSTIATPYRVPDLASVVQKIVRMENLDLYFAVVLMGSHIHIIAQNRLPEIDVGKLLSEFGGGGHAYTATAKVTDQTLAQVELRLLDMLQMQLNSIQVAKKLMSSPAITIASDRTCRDAGTLMTRYNINTLLVVDKDTATYEGYITRQIVEKLLFHKLGNQLVEDYMESEVSSISLDADLAEIEEKLIEDKQGIVPVMEKEQIKGVITRTDLLDYLVEHSREMSNFEKQILNRPNAKRKYVRYLLDQRLNSQIRTLLKDLGRTADLLDMEIYVVGGFVRDLLLDRPNEDMDVVVEGNGIVFAKHVAKEKGCRVHPHHKFNTAVIIFEDGFKVDVVSARREYYTMPAALPIVENSSIKLDMARRDFTINTLAIGLNHDNYGILIDYFGAERDLKDKTIRILHNLSFVEDPTRVFRAIKFANRFGFKIGKVTSNLIKNALKINTFQHLSGLRVLSELKQIFSEENPIPAVKTMAAYGIHKVIHKELHITRNILALFEAVNKALAWHDLLYVDETYPRWAVYFMVLLNPHPQRVCEETLNRLMVPEKERHMLLERRQNAEARLRNIENRFPMSRQELYWALINFKTESLLYMMALCQSEEIQKAISNFYTHDRHATPIIRGRDLLAIGIKPGPIYTKIMGLIINEKLDKKLVTKKEELAFATQYAIENDLIKNKHT